MQITRPTLLLNEGIARKNIAKMAHKAQTSHTNFRPHFKTHFSSKISDWYRNEGVNCCTVSSVEMATYFSNEGWKDITIAFPFNRLELPTIMDLASNSVVNLVIEDRETLNYVVEHSTQPVNYFLKIDVGTGRTGLNPTLELKHLILNNNNITFKGFLGHAGHSYRCRDSDSIQKIYNSSAQILLNLKDKYAEYNPIISYGDTPTCSVVEGFPGIDEIRPGNFIFYDWMQYNITSCSFEDIAVCMAVPIVAKHQDRGEIVIHGGAVHFSKDYIEVGERKTFGKLVRITERGWELGQDDCHLERLSQEHGILKVADSQLFNQLKIGEIIGVIPIHSCLAANLMGSYLTLTGSRISQMPKNEYL